MHRIALIVVTLFTLHNRENVRLVMVHDYVGNVGEMEKHRPFVNHFRKNVEYVMELVYAKCVNER
jgi:hypothetical protein